MEQISSSSNRRSLLDSAASQLNAEVFSHPVWIRFGRKDTSSCLHIADELFNMAEHLQDDDPSTACQVLLICAVYLNHAGQSFQALKSIQQALELSRRTSRSRERIWALWGGCSLSIQQGKLDQATTHLVDLQAALSEQNEWILADFVDVIRQSLCQPDISDTGSPFHGAQDRQVIDLLSITFDWLQHWGFSSESPEGEVDLIAGQAREHRTTHTTWIRSFFSIQHWQDRWQSLMVAMRGELKMQWITDHTVPAQREFSSWRSFLRRIRAYLPDRNAIPAPADDRLAAGWMPIPADKKRDAPGGIIPLTGVADLVQEEPTRSPVSGQPAAVLPVAVHMLGLFHMSIGDLSVKLPPSRSLSLLKYLMLHHRQTITRDVLMDVFWPDAEPETARNNLNVAMHSLRKALRSTVFLPVILFQDGSYVIDNSLQVWLDVDAFENCVQTGRQLEARDQLSAAAAEYETAISLYQGDLLEQNLYEEWTVVDRERLRVLYLDALDRLSHIYFNQVNLGACILFCQRILALDSCSENAHRRLMQCFSRQGQKHLAVKQYHLCVEAVRRELDTTPEPATVELYEQLRRGHRI